MPATEAAATGAAAPPRHHKRSRGAITSAWTSDRYGRSEQQEQDDGKAEQHGQRQEHDGKAEQHGQRRRQEHDGKAEQHGQRLPSHPVPFFAAATAATAATGNDDDDAGLSNPGAQPAHRAAHRHLQRRHAMASRELRRQMTVTHIDAQEEEEEKEEESSR